MRAAKNEYESERAAPKFDAKGIETVRRDGCLAERKVLEKCLRLLEQKEATSSRALALLTSLHAWAEEAARERAAEGARAGRRPATAA